MKSKHTPLIKRHVLVGLIFMSLSAYCYLAYQNNKIENDDFVIQEKVIDGSEIIPSIIVMKKIYNTLFKDVVK
jgi:hypothetical protein